MNDVTASRAGARLLTLRAGSRECTVPAALVDGVGPLGRLCGVPGAPRPVLGLAEWRGRVVTVIDLAGLLGGSAAEPTWIVRLAAPLGHAALAVTALPTMAETVEPAARDVAAEVAALCGGGAR